MYISSDARPIQKASQKCRIFRHLPEARFWPINSASPQARAARQLFFREMCGFTRISFASVLFALGFAQERDDFGASDRETEVINVSWIHLVASDSTCPFR